MIRQLRHDEIDQYMDMTQVAFAVRYTEDEVREKSKHVVPEHIWGYYLDDRLSARVGVLPFQIMLHGVKFDMGGIAHVATYPELRRNGMVGKLMEHCLAVMKQNGQTVSMLNPFSFAFYRKYGWENFSDYASYSLPTLHIPRFPDVLGSVRRGDVKDLEVLKKIYEVYYSRYNGMLVRDDEWWVTNVLNRKLGNLAIYLNEAGEPRGYFLYKFLDKKMWVSEFVTLDADSRKGLWQFIANHDSIIEGVEISAPVNDPSALWFKERKGIKREFYAYFMFRIVDVPEFLRRYPFSKLEQGVALTLSVRDEHAPWNEGTWRLAWQDGGRVTVERAGARDELDVECDIRALSTMLCGYQRPEVLTQIAALQGSEEAVALLERAVPRGVPFLLDMF